jgi:hypothetical protein
MKPKCLNERDLTLLHYGEVPEGITPETAAAHLAACAACRTRREQLAAALARIPTVPDADPVVATRIAARVNERLSRKRRWLPVAGAATAGAIALTMAVIVWMPGTQPPATSHQQLIGDNQPPASNPQVTGIDQFFVGPPRPLIHQATLDLDLLDKLDLLEELETLRAIEGV